MADIKIPATSASAKPVVVPDHFNLHDNLQLALQQLGDGFFPLEGTVSVNNVSRSAKDVNGEVIAGSGLHVIVRDFLAMVDGVVIGGKNAKQFAPVEDQTILSVPANAASRIILSTPHIMGSDGDSRPDYVRGVLSVVPLNTVLESDQLLLAIVTVPNSVTQVTSGMISDARKFLTNIDDIQIGNTEVDAALFDLTNVLNIARTNFKVDTLLAIQGNSLANGFTDALVNTSDIDTGLSSTFAGTLSLDPTLTRIKIGGTSVGGLVAYWDFAEPSGSAVLDKTGNGNDGVLDGSILRAASGGPGGGPYLDFQNGPATDPSSAVIIPAPPALVGLNAVTIAMWVNDRNLSQQGVLCLAVGPGNSTDVGYFIVTDHEAGTDGSIAWAPTTSPGETQVVYNQNSVISANTWHHIAVTFDPTANPIWNMYIDGVLLPITSALQQGGTLPLSANNVAEMFGIGNWIGNQTYAWTGYIGPVAIFNQALSGAQVLALYNNVVVSFAPPTLPAHIVSKAHTAGSSPAHAMLVADGSGDITYSISRDNGTTWTSITPNVLFTFGAEPSGTQIRYKAFLPAITSYLDNIAVFWS